MNNKPKIIFFINSIQNQRCTKRIQDFIDHGYDVIAYGFSRKTVIHSQSNNFKIEIIGEFSNSMNYIARLVLMYNSINKVLKIHKTEKKILYYFGLDIAMIGTLISKYIYIYEESDLAHTYIKNYFVQSFLDRVDKRIIRRSFKTIFTSEGFSLYHFGNKAPNNIEIIPNRLNKEILSLECAKKNNSSISNLKIGFVGGARFKSVYNFSKIIANHYPQHEFHFFGNPVSKYSEFETLRNYPNIFFHGPFNNPSDLPLIYSKIDLVVSTYDVDYKNVRYAEPNKIYESIYFRTPILVSKKTFLADKVKSLDIGYSIDPLNDNEVHEFLDSLTLESLSKKVSSIEIIPQEIAIDDNNSFFKKLNIALK